MHGIKNQEKTSVSNILPPCRVCGEPGTGFHYGVNTCGACKGFFRRSLVRPEPYECSQSPLCHVGPRTNQRQSCRKCRYDKCIAMGMSRGACKVGRYSLIKKSLDFKEVVERRNTPTGTNTNIFTKRKANGWQDNCHPTSETLLVPTSSSSSPLKGNLSEDPEDDSPFNESNTEDYTTSRLIELDDALNVQEQLSHDEIIAYSQTCISYSQDSADLVEHDNHILLDAICSFSAPSTRQCEQTCKESESTIERPHVSDYLDPESSRKLFTEESNVLVSSSKDEKNTRREPIVLYLVEPDPMKYVLSIFEEFPFKSFEKNSLAPLLKLCYSRNEWANEYSPRSIGNSKQLSNVEHSPKEQISTPTIHLHSIMPLENPPQTSTFVQESSYDAIQMDNLFEYVRVQHCRHYGPECSLNASQRHKYTEMFHKICQLQESLQGTLNLIDEDMYYQVLKSTGVDVDKRKEWFSLLYDDIEEVTIRDSKFFRALPGVKCFSLNDRVTLLKSTSMLYTGLRNHNFAVDFNLDVSIDNVRGVATRLTSMLKVMPGLRYIYDDWQCVLTALEDLAISHDEYIIFKALVLIFPDYCEDLEDRELVTAWHNTYLNCMLHLLRKSHGSNADEQFNKIVDILQKLRSISGRMKKSQLSIKNQIECLANKQEAPLHTEIWVNLPFQEKTPNVVAI